MTRGGQPARPGYLVLSDSYFPGWIAELRPAGKPDADAVTLPILRADYNFRAVALDAGEYAGDVPLQPALAARGPAGERALVRRSCC